MNQPPLAASILFCNSDSSYMSEGYFRERNIPANLRATSRSRPSLATGHKIDPKSIGQWRISSENAVILKWTKSEPSVVVPVTTAPAEDEDETVLHQTRMCTDIFLPPEDSPRNRSPAFDKDAKVVVNVTVEGSAGPIRAMIKLGSNVEDAIKLVVNKYNEEGRTPRLDRDAATTCELYHSCFGLQSLSRSDLVGEVGSRSFYLRKCSIDKSRSEGLSTSPSRLPALSLSFLPRFIAHKMRKIILRTRKLWELLCCIR